MAVEGLQIAARPREGRGKGPARRMRAGGWIPAVIYGHSRQTECLAVEKGSLEKVLASGHRIVSVEVEGSALKALIREVQVEPATSEVLHVDFVEVSEHERVRLKVPLVYRGTAEGTKEGGVLEVQVRDLEIECPADSAPDEIRVDVSGLGLGQSLRVSDLVLPEELRALADAAVPIATLRPPREEEAEEEVAAPAEEAAAAGPEVIAETKREERKKEAEEK